MKVYNFQNCFMIKMWRFQLTWYKNRKENPKKQKISFYYCNSPTKYK